MAKGGGVKAREKELNDWYGRQPFDNVEKITSVNLWDLPEEERDSAIPFFFLTSLAMDSG
jgi:hypothetical protein